MANETNETVINETITNLIVDNTGNQELNTQIILLITYFILLTLSNLGMLEHLRTVLSFATLITSLLLLFMEFTPLLTIVLIGVSFINIFKD